MAKQEYSETTQGSWLQDDTGEAVAFCVNENRKGAGWGRGNDGMSLRHLWRGPVHTGSNLWLKREWGWASSEVQEETEMSSQRAVGKFVHRAGGVRGEASRKEKRDRTDRKTLVQSSPDIPWTDGWMSHQMKSP